jgi:hypothetical protein
MNFKSERGDNKKITYNKSSVVKSLENCYHKIKDYYGCKIDFLARDGDISECRYIDFGSLFQVILAFTRIKSMDGYEFTSKLRSESSHTFRPGDSGAKIDPRDEFSYQR